VGTDKRERQKANRERARQDRIRKQQRTKLTKRGLIFGLGIPAIVLALFAVSWATGGDDAAAPAVTTVATTIPGVTPTVSDGLTACPKTDGTQERVSTFTSPIKNCIDAAKSYTATFDTSEGSVVVALNSKTVPGTVNNFVSLSRYKFYNGTQIFRTDPSIDIIQGGGFSPGDSFGYTIKDEGGPFKYSEGDLVMARTMEPNSGGSQFFFVTGPKASALDGQGPYVTFGKATKGLDVLKKIIALHDTSSSGVEGRPSRAVTVKSITINEK
jgi:cyclophilin family peptidyl-prolyl cis-trans isomerase